jgi:hypothetical protein
MRARSLTHCHSNLTVRKKRKKQNAMDCGIVESSAPVCMIVTISIQCKKSMKDQAPACQSVHPCLLSNALGCITMLPTSIPNPTN